MRDNCSELKMLYGTSNDTRLLEEAWSEAEAQEGRFSPSYVAVSPFLTLILAVVLLDMSGWSLRSPSFTLGAFFAGVTIAIVIMLLEETLQALKNKRVHFRTVVTLFSKMVGGKSEMLESIERLQRRANSRKKLLFICLSMSFAVFPTPWHEDAFWHGLLKVVRHQDISHYYFTGAVDLVAVLVSLVFIFGLVGVFVGCYWLKNLKREGIDQEVVV